MFNKIPASGQNPATVLFYYDKNKLFNDVSLMSNYMAKNLTSKDGAALTDEYAISDDERDIFDVCSRAALPDLYEAMTKITHGVSDSFDDDYVVNAGSADKEYFVDDTGAVIYGEYVTFRMQDNGAYNENVLFLVDASLLSTIKQSILKEYFSIVIQPEFFKVTTDRYIAELYKLKQRLFQLKKKSVSSLLSS